MPKQTRATDTLREEQQHAARRKAEQSPSAQTSAANTHLQRLPDHPAAATPADVAAMQKSYGNRAVQRLLNGHTIQAKLEVGPANDQYEQEADQVAAKVMRMPTEEEEKEKQ